MKLRDGMTVPENGCEDEDELFCLLDQPFLFLKQSLIVARDAAGLAATDVAHVIAGARMARRHVHQHRRADCRGCRHRCREAHPVHAR